MMKNKKKLKPKKKINSFDKRGIEISFSWLFAIVVGAFIIFLAIYSVMKIMGTSGELTTAQTSAEIGVLLNPLETGFETGRVTLLRMPTDTIIHNRCDPFGNFGRQLIRVSQKSLGRWAETNIDVAFSNKYLFSEADVEGRNFFIFSKPFNFPFKISDVIYITSSKEKYCFIDSNEFPQKIKEEIENFNQENFYFQSKNCPSDSIKVCFDYQYGVVCDIKVSYTEGEIVNGEVEKNGQTVYFVTDALMYGAIFSHPEIYECQVKRLMMRAENLALLYGDKSVYLNREGCSIDIGIFSFIQPIRTFEDSSELFSVAIESINLEKNHNRVGGRCELW